MGEVTLLVLKGCTTVVAVSMILPNVPYFCSKLLKGRGGCDKMCCYKQEGTSQVRVTVDGGVILLFRAIVVVIHLLLVIAGDVETNPGPGGNVFERGRNKKV